MPNVGTLIPKKTSAFLRARCSVDREKEVFCAVLPSVGPVKNPIGRLVRQLK
jgi:hypothetical protein